jgi:hypothetical protein
VGSGRIFAPSGENRVKLHRNLRSTVVAGLTAIGLIFGFGGSTPLPAQEPPAEAGSLKIVVLEGEDGVNIVKKKSAVRPVVEVRDRNNLPVAGASVIFLAPNSGPSAVFHGTRSLTVMTDSAGRATVSGMKPVGTGGFKLQVKASFHGQTGTTSITQTNYLTAAAASSAGAGAAGGAVAGGTAAGLSVGVIAGIVGGAAAAAAIGAVVATRGGTKNPAAAGTIGLGGGPTIGPPH